MKLHTRAPRLTVGVFSFVVLVFVLIACPAWTTQTDEEFATRIQSVYALRSEGKYDQAIETLRGMIEEYSDAEMIQRELYNELVKTVHQKRNATQDPQARAELDRDREALARETLSRYPDIQAGVGYSGVDALYDALRAEMFGGLEIITDPDSCDVMIDGEYLGKSPYRAEYFPVGAHTVRIIKSGHEESEVTIDVEPSETLSKEIDLKSIKGKGWWLTRVVTPVAIGVGVILALSLSGGDEEVPPPGDEPLPGPPPPPAN